MLELITKSKIRRSIILLFIYNQSKEYYLSEIAKLVGASVGTVQRELNRLLRNDLIIFKKKAGLNLYALNKQYPLLGEIESIIKKTIGIEVELSREMSKIKEILFAFIYGSYVKGGFKHDSDVDLFIIGEPDEDKVFKAVQRVEKIAGREINYHLASKSDFAGKLEISSFIKDIVNKYILLKGDKDELGKIIGQAG
jgi:predicted nucleotidyltransferase